jgi:hypothetical protein
VPGPVLYETKIPKNHKKAEFDSEKGQKVYYTNGSPYTV